jgi:hypothetical protein
MGWAAKENQVCLAHLIRDVQYVIDEGERIFAPALRHLLGRACRIGRRLDQLADATLKTYAAEARLDDIMPPHADACGWRQTAARDQKDPPPSVRFRHQSGDPAVQQRIGAGAARLRHFPQDNQRLSHRVGRPTLEAVIDFASTDD